MTTLGAGKFQGCLENLGMPSTSSKAGPKSPVWASRVFTVGDRRTKSGVSPRKEGIWDSSELFWKWSQIWFLVFLAWTRSWLMSDAALPLRLLSHVIPSLAPRPWRSTGPSLKPPCNLLRGLAWVPTLLAAFSNYFSHYWVSFHSDCLQHLESFSFSS